ncbi:DUF1127 domain-containing protein [Ruegeria arenilitoris]|uniref:DUF1127 domain-containing protein n=1 Tax=Ruegeria arenilitoris TaxID=1173585 RepID=UPI00147C5C57|nr:DUF1127 domain-containing protein [Ruegeria arenilitoris]
MANTRSITSLEVVLHAGRTVFQQKRDAVRAAITKRKVYLNTYRELSNLTDRDLNDLGIPRGSIKGLAKEAANDL